MAFENVKETIEGLESFADNSGNQHRCMKYNANGQAEVCAADDPCKGVLQNKPAAQGDAASVAVGGRTKLVSDGSGAILAGDSLAAGVDGKAKVATPGAQAFGYAVTAAAAVDGEIFTADLDLHVAP